MALAWVSLVRKLELGILIQAGISRSEGRARAPIGRDRMHDPHSMAFDHRDSTRDSGTRPGVPTASTCWRGALPDFDVFGSRPFRPLTSFEGHGLALTKIVEPGTSARRVVEEVTVSVTRENEPETLCH